MLRHGLFMLAILFTVLSTRAQHDALLTLNSYMHSPDLQEEIHLVGLRADCEAKVESGKDLVTVNRDVLQFTSKGKSQFEKNKGVRFTMGVYKGNELVEKKQIMIIPPAFFKNGVIAHRGAWKKAAVPQNSMASLKQAIRLGCAGSEFDVFMTRDSVLVLNHDPDHKGLKIEETSYADLSVLTLDNGEKLPKLEDILEEGMKQLRTKLIVEVKPSGLGPERARTIATETVKLVHRMGAQAWVEYISFDYNMLKRIIELDPSAEVAYLRGEVAPEQLRKDKMTGVDYNFAVYKKNPEWIRQAKLNGLTVNAWTVNAEDVMDWLLKEKADYITTDEPELLLKKVKSKGL